MKKIIIFTLLVLFIGALGSSAQQRMNREKIALLKTSYITDALNLSSSEAEKFWPIYNLYTDNIQELKRKLQNNFLDTSNGGSIETISEDKAKEILTEFMLLEKKISKTKIEMILELEKVLSAKKIVLLQEAERDFNRRILQEYGQRKRMQGQ